MSVVIVGVIRRKPVLTHASIVCEGMLASVNSVNSVKKSGTALAVSAGAAASRLRQYNPLRLRLHRQRTRLKVTGNVTHRNLGAGSFIRLGAGVVRRCEIQVLEAAWLIVKNRQLSLWRNRKKS